MFRYRSKIILFSKEFERQVHNFVNKKGNFSWSIIISVIHQFHNYTNLQNIAIAEKMDYLLE